MRALSSQPVPACTIALVTNSLTTTMAYAVRVLVWTFAVLMVLGEVGLNLAPLLAGASIAGVALGFGAQSVYEDLTGDLASTRQMGTETSRALSGKAFELMLGSFQAFYDQLVYEYGQDVVDENIDLVHQWYDQTTILPGYEAWYGHAAGDAQTCHGDSGGPVLHKATDAGNLTDRKNPRDVFNNISSPFFGHFVGIQHRFFEGDVDLVF